MQTQRKKGGGRTTKSAGGGRNKPVFIPPAVKIMHQLENAKNRRVEKLGSMDAMKQKVVSQICCCGDVDCDIGLFNEIEVS